MFWVVSGFGALIAIVGLVTLPETYHPRILHKKRNALQKSTGNTDLYTLFEKDGPRPALLPRFAQTSRGLSSSWPRGR